MLSNLEGYPHKFIGVLVITDRCVVNIEYITK